ncbi:MAG: T9SS C-terminal target domain-containing protein, partial [Bacteroidetes bacterium]
NRNGCDPTPDSLNLPDLVNEGSTVTRFYWNGPPGTSEVYLYRINGGGHSWPGAFPVPGVNTNQDIRGSRLIWDFFSAHMHPNPAPLLTALGPDRLPSSLHIWPNPAHEVIRISDIPASAEQLRVTDAMGRVVYEEGIGEIRGIGGIKGVGELAVSVQGWAEGVYFVSLYAGPQVSSTRFVKRN